MASRTSDWRADLRARGYRLTPQRELILRAVQDLDHATPEDVLAEVRKTAKGVNVSSFGRTVTDYQLLAIPAPAISDEEVSGEVLRVDRFGNLITNIDRRTFDRIAHDGIIAVSVGGREVPRIVATYAEAAAGDLCALFGSTNHLEVAVNAGSAAEVLGLGRGAAVNVRRSP